MDVDVMSVGCLYRDGVSRGRDLGGCSRQQGRVQVMLAVDYILEACDASGRSARLGIVHRDFKPANSFSPIVRTARRSPRFSTSAYPDEGVGYGMTSTVALMGSPVHVARHDDVVARRRSAHRYLGGASPCISSSRHSAFPGHHGAEVCARCST